MCRNVSASPYDADLSALRNHVDDLGVWLGIWEGRTEPDARARRCANDAVDALDAMLGHLYGVRAQLVSEIRQADDATAARADELLRGEALAQPGHGGDVDLPGEGSRSYSSVRGGLR
jgi:hypothetical protein